MKARILELIITPENIVSEDLQILKDEIAVQPYAQSLRALYLLGTKKYDAENFQKVLSTTAAYTTDKKILYQFINGKIYEPKTEETIPEISILKKEETPIIHIDENITDEYKVVEDIVIENKIVEEGNYLAEIPKKDLPEKVVLDGKVNRILFAGEENFLNEESTAKIDKEATAESGVLVTEKLEDDNAETEIFLEKSPENFKKDLLSLRAEKIGSEEAKILVNDEIKPEISDQNRIPENAEIKIETEKAIINVEKTPENKYEIERKKLAEEIERKMSRSKSSPKISLEEENFDEENATVDFFHSQEFTIKDDRSKPSETTLDKPKNENKDKVLEILNEEFSTENIVDENTQWKPMTASETPSSRFKRAENSNNENENTKSEFETETTENTNEEINLKLNEPELIIDEEDPVELEVPALDISFFTPKISQIKIEDPQEEVVELSKISDGSEKSNVPVFINTWQNWLKIDRSEEKIIEKIEIPKEKARSQIIDKFIDTAPKISKFKEDGTFQVQEKKDDISHLMTETLAKLFVTQKLYSKAINAYKVLQEKHPEKVKYFDEKIEEIKGYRQK